MSHDSDSSPPGAQLNNSRCMWPMPAVALLIRPDAEPGWIVEGLTASRGRITLRPGLPQAQAGRDFKNIGLNDPFGFKVF